MAPINHFLYCNQLQSQPRYLIATLFCVEVFPRCRFSAFFNHPVKPFFEGYIMRALFFSAALSMVWIATVSSQPLIGQNSFGVLDGYYSDILMVDDSTFSVSQKILYPGLVQDSKQTIAAGFLSPGTYSSASSINSFDNIENPSTALRWSDLYGWGEFDTRLGKLGGWIGDISASDELTQTEAGNFDKQQSASSRVALWWNPHRMERLKGISLQVDGEFNTQDRSFQNSSSTGYYSSTYKSERNTINDLNHGSLTTLWQLNKSFLLNAGFSGSYSRTISENTEYQTYRSYYASNSSSRDFYRYKGKGKNVGLFAGLLTPQGRQAMVTLSANTNNYTRERSDRREENQRIGNGGLDVVLSYSESHTLNYKRHSLKMAVGGMLGASFPIDTAASLSFTDLAQDFDTDTRMTFGLLKVPVVFDINLFNHPVYAIFRLTPQVTAEQFSNIDEDYNIDKDYKGRTVNLRLQEVAVGIRGTVFEHLEYSLIPSLKANIFVTGLELRYTIPSSK